MRARIRALESFSRHADAGEIMRWLSNFKKPPRMTFIVHGESGASESLAAQINKTLGWKTHIPNHLETITLL